VGAEGLFPRLGGLSAAPLEPIEPTPCRESKATALMAVPFAGPLIYAVERASDAIESPSVAAAAGALGAWLARQAAGLAEDQQRRQDRIYLHAEAMWLRHWQEDALAAMERAAQDQALRMAADRRVLNPAEGVDEPAADETGTAARGRGPVQGPGIEAGPGEGGLTRRGDLSCGEPPRLRWDPWEHLKGEIERPNLRDDVGGEAEERPRSSQAADAPEEPAAPSAKAEPADPPAGQVDRPSGGDRILDAAPGLGVKRAQVTYI
jgi:hypothetical protein